MLGYGMSYDKMVRGVCMLGCKIRCTYIKPIAIVRDYCFNIFSIIGP